jgi:hypothetical protein
MGRAPEQLSLAERLAWTGKYIALPIYTPQSQPLRRIAAMGDSVDDCLRQLKGQGLNMAEFEFTRLEPPF